MIELIEINRQVAATLYEEAKNKLDDIDITTTILQRDNAIAIQTLGISYGSFDRIRKYANNEINECVSFKIMANLATKLGYALQYTLLKLPKQQHHDRPEPTPAQKL